MLGALLSGMLMAGSTMQASAIEIVKSYDYSPINQRLEGYVISHVNDEAMDEGIVAAGNYAQGGGIHFFRTDDMGNTQTSVVYTFPGEDDVRVVSLVTWKSQRFLLTIQDRSSVGMPRAITLLLDNYGNILAQYSLLLSGDSGFGPYMFPMHTVQKDGILYICGYVTHENAAYPLDPQYTDDRTSFVAKIDLDTRGSDVHFYNTDISPTPGYSGLYNDYDAAMRLRILNDRLYVTGSGNGNSTAETINTSQAWVAELDLGTLAPVNSGYYGTNAVPPGSTPADLLGMYALDVMPDNVSMGFFTLANDFAQTTWKVSHVDNSLTINSVPGGGNTFVFNNYGNQIKANGFHMWNSGMGPLGRATIYGTAGSDLPLVNSGAWGTTIENTANGAVPFVLGTDISWHSFWGIGFGPNPANGHVIGNQLGYGSGLNYQEPFSTLGSMGEWCNPDFGMKNYPNGSDDGMSLIGHFTNNSNYFVNPRLAMTNPEGFVTGCQATEAMDIFISSFILPNGSVLPTDIGGHTYEGDYTTDQGEMMPSIEFDCAYDNVYRTAKPSPKANDAKGLYPNPATDHVTVMLGQVKDGDAVTITLTDVTGRVVLNQAFTAAGNSLQVALPRLTAGMYQAGVRINAGKADVYKLVIQ